MIPQKFKDAEIQLYKKNRAHALETGVIILLLAGKRNFYLCWNNGQQTRRFGLVEERLMQFCSQGNLRKAENKGLYIVFVK